MKHYVGQRPPDDEVGDCRVVVIEDGHERPLTPITHHTQPFGTRNPQGAFEWGYGGSGPADLALSILCDVLGEKPTDQDILWGECEAWTLHQGFKWKFLAPADRAGFELAEADILAWVQERRKNQHSKGLG